MAIRSIFGCNLNNQRLNDMRDLLRAGMAKNHSELLIRFSEIDSHLAKLEQQRLIQ